MINSPIRRLGKKNKVLDVLLPHFPKFNYFIEPFSGSGSVGLNVSAKIKFLNDLDANIYDFWRVMESKKSRERLISYLERVMYSDKLWEYFKQVQPTNIIKKVAKFLILSNWGYMGMPETLRIDMFFSKTYLLKQLRKVQFYLAKDNIKWSCKPFDAFLDSISVTDDNELKQTFIYCDPPYLGTRNNYDTPTWTESDLRLLVQKCVEFGCKFAISEFENDTILDLQQQYGLNLIVLGERRNMKNRRNEILLTNYETNSQSNLFL